MTNLNDDPEFAKKQQQLAVFEQAEVPYDRYDLNTRLEDSFANGMYLSMMNLVAALGVLLYMNEGRSAALITVMVLMILRVFSNRRQIELIGLAVFCLNSATLILAYSMFGMIVAAVAAGQFVTCLILFCWCVIGIWLSQRRARQAYQEYLGILKQDPELYTELELGDVEDHQTVASLMKSRLHPQS